MGLLTLACLLCSRFLVYVRSEWLAEASPAVRGLLFGLTLHSPKANFASCSGKPGVADLRPADLLLFRYHGGALAAVPLSFPLACILKP